MRILNLMAGLAFLAVLIQAPVGATAAPANDPGQFIQSLGDRVLQLLDEKSGPEAQRKQQFAEIADQSFDVPKIARFVLGRYWSTASDSDKQDFTKAFETYMTNVYWTHFQGYAGITFKVTGQQPMGNGAVVHTEFSRPNGQPPARVDWQVAKTGDGYRIIDASLEGVSQAVTYQQEFSSVIAQNGGKVSALTADLRQKANG